MAGALRRFSCPMQSAEAFWEPSILNNYLYAETFRGFT